MVGFNVGCGAISPMWSGTPSHSPPGARQRWATGRIPFAMALSSQRAPQLTPVPHMERLESPDRADVVSRNPARPRVLHVIGRMQPGGTEIRLLEIMRNLCPSEFHVDVCTLSSLEGTLDAQVRTYGGRVISVPLNASFPLGFTRLLRRERYSVVQDRKSVV